MHRGPAARRRDRRRPADQAARRDAGDARAEPPRSPTDSGPAFQAHVRAARSELENQVAHARAEFEEANERIKERTGRDLILATLIGLAIGAVLLGSLIFVKWLFVRVRPGGGAARRSSSSPAR